MTKERSIAGGRPKVKFFQVAVRRQGLDVLLSGILTSIASAVKISQKIVRRRLRFLVPSSDFEHSESKFSFITVVIQSGSRNTHVALATGKSELCEVVGVRLER